MVYIDRQCQRYHVENEWLSAYWHFSFDHYHDPARICFGALRTFNDDTIRPRGGFPMHPHRDVEIVTVVLSGTLEHEDNLYRSASEAGQRKNDLAALLSRLGYETLYISRWGPELLAVADWSRHLNRDLLALPLDGPTG